jgi:hypothetical protein
MSKVYNSRVRVLAHGLACTELGSVFCNERTGRCILVLEEPGLPHGRKEPVVGKEFEARGLDVGLEPVELYAISVVDEDILLLGNGKMGLVVEKAEDSD